MFASRKHELKRVPLEHRPQIGVEASEAEMPYLEPSNPSPVKEKHAFYQTWFFFGLLAEILGINEQATRAQELDALYAEFVVRDDADGKEYVVGRPLFEEATQKKIVDRLMEGRTPEEIGKRLNYLQDCFKLTYDMVVWNSHSKLERSTHFSICALGELLSTTLSVLRMPGVVWQALPWHLWYMEPGSEVEKLMLAEGWCISHVERVRNVYQGLNTLSFISRLKTPEKPRKDHSKCSKNKCDAAQIVVGEYQLSHSELDKDRSCDIVRVDVGEVDRILRETDSFPVLKIEVPEAGWSKMTVAVETYTGAEPYVALSHVRSRDFLIRMLVVIDEPLILGLGRWSRK